MMHLMDRTPRHCALYPNLLRGLVALLVFVSFSEMLALQQAGAIHSNDFKHLWAGAWLLAHGRNPYDPAMLFTVAASQGWQGINPFVYLPATGLFLKPFAALPFEAARDAWLWLNWALAWAVVLAGPALIGARRPWPARLAGACFLIGAMPFMRQMTAGQMNVVTAALIVGAVWAFRRRRDWLLGLLLAVGFGWKIAPAILIAALVPLRRWRALAWGIGFSAALMLASVALYGVEIHRDALAMISQMGYGKSTWAELGSRFHLDPFNQAPGALMLHLFTQNPITTPWSDLGAKTANALTIGISIVLLAAWIGPAWRKRSEAAFLAATLLMLLIPSLMWDHYAVQALPALMWIFGLKDTWSRKVRAIAALVIFALLAIPWNHQSESFRSGAGILLMSLRLWPIIGLFAWATFWSKEYQ